jgi:hypothetical protein
LGGAGGEAVPQDFGTDRKAQRVKIPLVEAGDVGLQANPNEEDTGYDSPGSGTFRESFVVNGVIRRR